MATKTNLIHLGLLILRIGIGIAFFFHGLPKIMGGTEAWMGIGGTMGILGIHFAPTFWGFMAAFAETAGGLLLALGLFLRPAALMLIFDMIVALCMHFHAGDSFMVYSHALEALIIFISLFISGAGKYSFDNKYFKKIA